jgi:hypothetical protein
MGTRLSSVSGTGILATTFDTLRGALTVARDELQNTATATRSAYDEMKNLPGVVTGVTLASIPLNENLDRTDQTAGAAALATRNYLNATLLLAPAIEDSKASLGAYDLIAINNVDTAGKLAEETRKMNAEFARAGIVIDFTAHTSNNASQSLATLGQEALTIGERLSAGFIDVLAQIR